MQAEASPTRYEIASDLARTLAYVENNSATQEQLKILKMMCVEFRDELDALGVRTEALDEKMGAFGSRLGGWAMSGSLQLDTDILPKDEGDPLSNRLSLARSRLDFYRYFGSDGKMFFHAQLEGVPNDGGGDLAVEFKKFYAGMNLPGEWRLSAGRFSMDFEGNGMYYAAGRFGDYSQGSWFTDVNKDSLGLTKNFSLGTFSAYVAGRDIYDANDESMSYAAFLAFKFNEYFALDLGINYDNVRNVNSQLDTSLTFWLAPRFDITKDIALKGAFYSQTNSYNDKTYIESENPTAWRAILDIKQSLLKFTSLWLEYDKFGQNFVVARGTGALILADQDYRDFFLSSNLGGDLAVWRVGLNQIWNSRWSTWLYFARYDYSDYPTDNGTLVNPSMDEISAGVEYRMSESTYFSLGYFYNKYNEDAFLAKKRTLNLRIAVAF